MQRHVHIAQKVDKKLERDLCSIVITRSDQAHPAQVHIVLQSVCSIPYPAENIDIPSPFPSFLSREDTRLARIVVRCADIMEWACPSVLWQPAHLVCPGSDWGKVAVACIVQDVAEDGHD
jgi:hypothetical protein